MGQQQAAGGKGRGRASAGAGAAVPEEQRLELIEAYREAKRRKLEAAGRGFGTTATPQSLAALVQRDKEAARQVQAQ